MSTPRQESSEAAGLRQLFNRLTCFKVLTWGRSSSDPEQPKDIEVADIKDAHVVSSLLRDPDPDGQPRHMVVIDIDHPAWLVKSTTPDHYHLYIAVPGGIQAADYYALLMALADAGVIEQGYKKASLNRDHSDVRLPWIKKGK